MFTLTPKHSRLVNACYTSDQQDNLSVLLHHIHLKPDRIKKVTTFLITKMGEEISIRKTCRTTCKIILSIMNEFAEKGPLFEVNVVRAVGEAIKKLTNKYIKEDSSVVETNYGVTKYLDSYEAYEGLLDIVRYFEGGMRSYDGEEQASKLVILVSKCMYDVFFVNLLCGLIKIKDLFHNGYEKKIVCCVDALMSDQWSDRLIILGEVINIVNVRMFCYEVIKMGSQRNINIEFIIKSMKHEMAVFSIIEINHYLLDVVERLRQMIIEERIEETQSPSVVSVNSEATLEMPKIIIEPSTMQDDKTEYGIRIINDTKDLCEDENNFQCHYNLSDIKEALNNEARTNSNNMTVNAKNDMTSNKTINTTSNKTINTTNNKTINTKSMINNNTKNDSIVNTNNMINNNTKSMISNNTNNDSIVNGRDDSIVNTKNDSIVNGNNDSIVNTKIANANTLNGEKMVDDDTKDDLIFLSDLSHRTEDLSLGIKAKTRLNSIRIDPVFHPIVTAPKYKDIVLLLTWATNLLPEYISYNVIELGQSYFTLLRNVYSEETKVPHKKSFIFKYIKNFLNNCTVTSDILYIYVKKPFQYNFAPNSKRVSVYTVNFQSAILALTKEYSQEHILILDSKFISLLVKISEHVYFHRESCFQILLNALRGAMPGGENGQALHGKIRSLYYHSGSETLFRILKLFIRFQEDNDYNRETLRVMRIITDQNGTDDESLKKLCKRTGNEDILQEEKLVYSKKDEDEKMYEEIYGVLYRLYSQSLKSSYNLECLAQKRNSKIKGVRFFN